MLSFTDQLGNAVVLENAPQRIISLVPSQTELLFDLGLDDEVIGVTKFCIHPAHWFKNKTRVGGTKTVNIEKIKSLSPDLVIANKEENVKQQIEALQAFAPVWVSDVNTLDDALDMINSIGQITNKGGEAKTLVLKIRQSFNHLSSKQQSTTNYQPSSHQQPTTNDQPSSHQPPTTNDQPSPHQSSTTNNQLSSNQPPTNNHQLSSRQLSTTNGQPLNSAYLIWRNPYMAAGGDTFIHDMLERCGFQNIFADQLRYPEVTICQLSSANLQLLLLSSEPYPFKQKHIDELQVHLPNTKILLVEGEMFSWYGSRLILAAEYFKGLKSQLNQ